ncbi:MAG: response regulator transcription factor [Pelagimonas sp.]|uniref:response regulator transcription factor n=1 Tax=Pelagimonas sp. TaxID=2073170 RepID=UPI003D6A82B4
MTPSDPARILIVEDDGETAAEVARLLRHEGWTPVHKDRLDTGIKAALDSDFDVIILDRMLPGGDGVDAIAQIQAGGSSAMILMLSALGLPADRTRGLDRGADDYLAKPFDAPELIARVRALLRRKEGQIAETEIMTFGALQIRLKARQVHVGDRHVSLSPREFDLLCFFAKNHGNVLTRLQLLEAVWNLHFDPQTNVVDVHVGRLRRKLDAALVRPVLHTQRGEGYLFDPDLRPVVKGM